MAIPLGNIVSSSGIGYIDGLLQGSKWSSNNLTYSLPTLFQGLSWSDNGIQLFADALQTIEHYTNLKFSYMGANGSPFSSTADLDAILTGSNLQYYYGFYGMAIFPDPALTTSQLLPGLGATRAQWPNVEGTIFYDNEAAPFLQGPEPAGFGWSIIIHEILHALGLKHPFDDGVAGRPTYQQMGLGHLDVQHFTVMSYNQTNGATYSLGNPATPMIMDVAALQYIYGANMNTNSGDNTHVFEDDGFNFTLWDAGGYDWFDGSPSHSTLVVNLNAGAFTYSSDTYFAIAYNTVIENAFGSHYADYITGNEIANVMHGLSGTDTIIGGYGDDIIYGGYTAVDPEDASDVIYGDGGSDTLYGNGGNDIIYGGFNVEGSDGDGADVIHGGIGADSLYGGLGDDSLYGGSGQDLIVAGEGNDWVSGGEGNDVFVIFGASGYDTILDFKPGDILSISRTATLQSFNDFAGKIISDVNGTFIPLWSSAGIILAGVAQSELDATDFYFFN